MNLHRFITANLCLLLCGQAFAQAQTMDKELSDLAEKLATQIKDHGKKKVAVLDFTDLQGGSSELGRYIAEQLSVNLVMGKRDFSVLDRANLKSILSEHKLTATGLVDPENAKKIGMFAGVDALILGNMVSMNQNIQLTAKIITTDTAEIVGAARAAFKADETVQQLNSKPAAETAAGGSYGGTAKDEAKVVKTLGDLRVELPPLQIVNGNQFLLTMTLTGKNPKKSLCAALNTDLMGNIKGRLTDSAGNEFLADRSTVSGIALNSYQQYHYSGIGFKPATEIPAGESISATVKFVSRDGRAAEPGACRLQLEFLSARDNKNDLEAGSVHNLACEINAN